MKDAIQKNESIHDAIINSIPLLQKAHEAQREEYFAIDLPFYTCIDYEKDIWRKENKNGKTVYVTFVGFDAANYKNIEKIIPGYTE